VSEVPGTERTIERDGDGYHLHQRQALAAPIGEVFDFFADPENLEAITPHRLRFDVQSWTGDEVGAGTRILYDLRLHGIPLEWVSEIRAWDPPRSFADVQLEGPYKRWEHAHVFVDRGDATVAIDRVSYELPLGGLGRLGHPVVRRDLAGIFGHRARELAERFGPAELDG
jgi:ligand-binding SRPBCC domain-containing protein